MANPATPYRTLADPIEAARREPGSIYFGSTALFHLAGRPEAQRSES